MRNAYWVACLTVAVVLLTACSTAPAPVAAIDTREADVRAIKDLEVAWIKDMNAKDVEKAFSYFADDATGLYPGMGILNGKQAIKAALAPFLADPNFAYAFQSTRTEASKGGDVVYSLGTYTMTTTNPKTKKPVTDKGKSLTVYRKQADGSWKAVADTYNSDAAM
jgi:uncharacterized protein (TIGR02246 family)